MIDDVLSFLWRSDEPPGILDFTFCHLLPPVILMGWCTLCTVGVVSIRVGTFLVA